MKAHPIRAKNYERAKDKCDSQVNGLLVVELVETKSQSLGMRRIHSKPNEIVAQDGTESQEETLSAG